MEMEKEMRTKERDERESWHEWKAHPRRARAEVRFRTGGSRKWTNREVSEGGGENGETVLAETGEQTTIEVENRGPAIVTVDGKSERTEYYGGDRNDPWEVKERKPCGTLAGDGERQLWLCENETIVATARPECFLMERPFYLEKINRKQPREHGKTGEDLVEELFRRAGVCYERADEGMKDGTAADFRARCGDRETVWEVKTVVYEEEGTTTDGAHGRKAEDRAMRNGIAKANRQLEAASREGRPTVLALVNLREHDPHALTGDEIAQALFGDMKVMLEGDEARTTGRSRREAHKARNVSAIATFSIGEAVPVSQSRGVAPADMADNAMLVCATRLYANPDAAVQAQRSDFEKLPAEWLTRERAAPRKAFVITQKVLESWDGFIERHVNEDGMPAEIAKGMQHMREEIYESYREAAEAAGEDIRVRRTPDEAGRKLIHANRRVFVLNRETPPEADEWWDRVFRDRTTGELLIAGTRARVTAVLRQMARECRESTAAERANEEERTSYGQEDRRTAAVYAYVLLRGRKTAKGELKGIESNPRRCHGAATIGETRIRVTDVLGSTGAAGEPLAAANEYRLTGDETAKALEYGALAVAEMESERKGKNR